jgi:hypothetical protein
MIRGQQERSQGVWGGASSSRRHFRTANRVMQVTAAPSGPSRAPATAHEDATFTTPRRTVGRRAGGKLVCAHRVGIDVHLQKHQVFKLGAELHKVGPDRLAGPAPDRGEVDDNLDDKQTVPEGGRDGGCVACLVVLCGTRRCHSHAPASQASAAGVHVRDQDNDLDADA